MPEEQPQEDEIIESAPVSNEDRYYLEQLYKEPAESLARIEDATKFLGGATATTSGIFLAAVRLTADGSVAARIWWFLPVLLWVMGILVFVRVLVPAAIAWAIGIPRPSSGCCWKPATANTGCFRPAPCCFWAGWSRRP